MLQRIRDGLQGKKWLAWVILGAIGATFVFWGSSGPLDLTGVGANTAAEVDGAEIPADEATEAWVEAQAAWAEARRTDMPADVKEAEQKRILDRLVLRKLINERLRKQHFRVSEAAVLAAWRDQFTENGQFNRAAASQYLLNARKTETQYRDEVREGLLQGQLQRGIGGSNFLTSAERKRLLDLENEERAVQYFVLDADKFSGNDPIDDAALQAYHAKNGDRFMTTESVALEYAELRLEQVASQVSPSENDLRQLYDENSAMYVRPEGRRVRLIAIGVTDDVDDATALKKAEAVVAEARAGKDFAELARANSTDATAATGGELGFVTRDQFQDALIGDTLFSMKVGDVSSPLKTEDGYQILKLEEIQAQAVRPFEEVRVELDSNYRTTRSADLFSERQEQIESMIEKGVNDIDKIAQDLALTRGSIPVFLKGGGAEPLGSSPELQQRVFSDAALNQGKVVGPVPLGDDRLVIFKVREHRKAQVKPVAEVREELIALVRHERGVAAAKAAAEAALKRLEGGEKIAEVAKSLGATTDPARFVGRGDPSIPAALSNAVFESPRPSGAPITRMTSLDNGSSALFVVTGSRFPDSNANPAMAEQQNNQLLMRVAQGEVAAYVGEALRKAKIVRNPKAFGAE